MYLYSQFIDIVHIYEIIKIKIIFSVSYTVISESKELNNIQEPRNIFNSSDLVIY